MAKNPAWLKNKVSTTPGMSDAYVSYMQTKSGISRTNLAQHERTVLSGLGFTSPDLSFAKKQFYAAKTGLPLTSDFATLENAFYSSNSNDFI